MAFTLLPFVKLWGISMLQVGCCFSAVGKLEVILIRGLVVLWRLYSE